MISVQILNKILQTGSIDIIQANNLTVDYFVGYENEYSYIKEHFQQYGKVPDKETFLTRFKDWVLLDVTEPDKFLVETINEEYIYYQTVPIIQKSSRDIKERLCSRRRLY